VRLGQYATGTAVTEGEQGFPVYVADEVYLSLAHPAGWAIGEEGTVCLRQYPGRALEPGARLATMQAVLGVARAGEARTAFLRHLTARMRRVRNGHDQPYAIATGFGSWDYDPVAEDCNWTSSIDSAHPTEEDVLDHLSKLAQVQREAGCHFDFDEIEFWVDHSGDLTYPDLSRFPRGFTPIKEALNSMGVTLGLWIDGSLADWAIGKNPVIQPTLTYDPAYSTERRTLCRATDPTKTMYTSAFLHHLRETNVGLLKFDDLDSICYNPTHAHLPGVYSTEAIQDAVIETLRRLDEEQPDLLIFLYWGHRSPWWLLHADTLSEPGLMIEAAHPSSVPALYVRDSVTQGLDQAQWYCQDVPPLGKDSLGVWLSSWKWNSCIGKERWQEAFVMDLCRGSLLGQIWADWEFLSPPERKQLALFIDLLKASPAALGSPRFILGNPWQNEAYGYCCSDGERAFIALNNCTWSDQRITFQLDERWNLPEDQEWELYRWYPNPIHVEGRWHGGEGGPSIALRPFDVTLYEVVRAGREPSLGCILAKEAVSDSFAEPSQMVPLDVQTAYDGATARQRLVLTGVAPPRASGGVLFVSAELRKGALAYSVEDIGSRFALTGTLGEGSIDCQPVVRERSYAVPWQGWRVAAPASSQAQPFHLEVTAQFGADIEIVCQGYFIPCTRTLLGQP
jgi:hypothetical protein